MIAASAHGHHAALRPARSVVGLTAAVVVPAGAYLLTGSVKNVVIALVLLSVGPPLFLKLTVARRRKRFAAQLPDALTTLAGSLRAGVPVSRWNGDAPLVAAVEELASTR